MLFECFGNGLFGHLASRFEEFYDGARRSMKEIETEAAANPSDTDALNALGLRYLQDAQKELAGRAFRRSLQGSPKDAFARLGLACSLYEAGKAQSALDEVDATLDAHPDYAPARVAARFIRDHLNDDPTAHEWHETLSVH